MNPSGKIHALFSTSRIANVPSVVVNVWLGTAIAAVYGGGHSLPDPWQVALPLALAGVLIYLAGNFFNDWMDRDWDHDHRPERALPRGLFTPGLYLGVAAAFALAGWILAMVVSLQSGLVAAAIIFSVVIYTVWHKRSPLAVIAMGLCRALLPVMGAMGFIGIFQSSDSSQVLQLPGGQMFQTETDTYFASPQSGALVAGALGLFCHIAGLSLSARHESMTHPPVWIPRTSKALFLATLMLMAAAAYGFSGRIGHIIVGMSPYALWAILCLSLWRKPVPVHVSRLLAGIPLVDWVALMPIALAFSFVPGGQWDPFSLSCLVLPPLAFVLALLLQRVAPAT